MTRLARVVAPGLPHHVTQQGVRSLPIFADDDDRRLYLALLREHAQRFGLRFMAWCLMTNHVHLVVVPKHEHSLARGIGQAHRQYTLAKNRAEGAKGYLFEGRFSSCVLDEPHLLAAARYTEMNPVRAGITAKPEGYRWSSARYHLGLRKTDPLLTDMRVVDISGNWRRFLRDATDEDAETRLARHISTGRPLGSEAFTAKLERKLGRPLAPRKRGWPKGKRRKHK